uniref:TPX2 microtubule nucleation factor n=1 Tax=Astyanax mexicanus TaxID=7994 RepID=W5KDD7_ASTMX
MDIQGDSADPYAYDAPNHVMCDFELDREDNADQWFGIGAPEPPSNIVTSWGSTTAAPTHKTTVPAQPRRYREHGCPLKRNSSVQDILTLSSFLTCRHRSTEQQELERIEALQKEVAEQRKRNEASYKAALAGSHLPKKQVLLKNQPDVTDASHKEGDFASQLRRHPASPLKAPRGTTIPKPFNLSTGNKRKHEEGEYVSMAQQIEQFQKRTPTRYHLRSRQSQDRGPSPVKTDKPAITHPHTPQLLTRQRSRPVMVKSAAEIEAEELEKMQQFKFKALELNRKILEGAVAPKKPAPKEATRPEGFQLEVEKRLQDRHVSKKPEEPENHTFHSRPLPTRILEEVVGVPEKKVLNPTVPESPAFALKNRVRMERKTEEVKPPAPIKALPVPHYLPFHPKSVAKNHVEMCPFSFEQREQERRAQKEKRLEELRNEEMPKFKARPLPDFHEVSLPEKKVIEPTKPAPFKLVVDERGATKGERWEHMVKEELKQQAEAACFKARPNAVVHKEPFVPKKENRSLLANTTHSAVPEGFQLSTERRAKERLEFERALKEKEALRAQVEEQESRDREEHEKEEIIRLRQEQVHKAQPIRRYKPVELKHSEATLTVPQSPKFSDRFRM